jgi:hypothetical protein
LVEAATGAHIWADRFDGTLQDVFDLQDRRVPMMQRRAHRRPAACLALHFAEKEI